MAIKKLETATLEDALSKMEVGETRLAPDGYSPRTVTKACCAMQDKGYMFSTSTKTGEQTITRLK